MTLLCTVMAWAGEVSTFEQLKAALSASGSDAVVTLANDIAYPTNGSDLLNIERSLTLDGQGHKIIGWGKCNSSHEEAAYYIYTPLAINGGEDAANLDVTIQNLTMSTLDKGVNGHEIGLMVFDKVSKLTISACDIRSKTKGANCSGIAIYGETSDALVLKIYDSFVSAGASGYGLSVMKPINADFQRTTFEGYSAATLYAPGTLMYAGYKTRAAFGSNNSGSRGTTINAKSCDFDAPNIHSGLTNAYGVFAIQDDGVDIILDNCGMNAQQIGDQGQWAILVSPWTPLSRRSQNVNITIKGDNSHINGDLGNIDWCNLQDDATGILSPKSCYMAENGVNWYDKSYHPELAFTYTGVITYTIEGGTYATNPEEYEYLDHLNTSAEGYTTSKYPEDGWFTTKKISIPATHEVKTITMEGVATPLYRVVPRTTTLYDLNDDVPTDVAGEGNNPSTSFELSTGTDMTLNQETTTAGYVQVKDNGTNATTVTVANNQTLVINNGLDVQGTSAVTAKPGSALVIGEGGIVTAKPENIVVEADNNGAASLLLDPTITVNQTPELTVKMVAKNVGKIGTDYFWHRFALPVDEVHVDAVHPENSTWIKDGHSYGTLLYKWDYTNNKWVSLSNVNEMQPFYGYTMTLDEVVTNPGDLKEAGYIFKGKLMGNVPSVLNFSRQGYNYFGNSYTGYISIVKLVDELIGNDNLDGTVWMWNPTEQRYEGIPLNDLKNNPTAARYTGANSWKAEVAPMQTFILRLMTEDTDTKANIDYATAVWGNPRYEDVTGALHAPARRAENNNETYVRVIVSAANGKADAVNFQEGVNFSDANDRGYDAAKYMNERTVNVYATVNGENYGTVATDNIEGQSLTINTIDEIAYTISFADVEGRELALRDNVTGQVINIEEGATYEFAAQPNSTVEGRFEIINRAQMPTAIENSEVNANAKGIYTIMGQYMGEDFSILPAGVYVVNGVKIVK